MADDLFELIQALTPSEKRYFKLHADSYSYGGYKKQYEKLFDALNHWPEIEYDEKEFRRRHKGKSFLKNLAADKSYLRDLILKVLRNFHSDQDLLIQLAEMLVNIHLLISKGLRSQAFKMIEKASRLAEQTERLTELLALDDHLINLQRAAPGEFPFSASRFEELDRTVISRIESTRQAIYPRMHIIEIKALAQWKQKEKEVADIMQQCALLEASGPITRRAKLSLFNIRQYYLLQKNDFAELLRITKPWLELMENPLHAMDFTTDQYRVTLANYMLCATHTNQYQLIPPCIEKLKAIKTTTEKSTADCFRLIASYQLSYNLNTKNFDSGAAFLPYIESGLLTYKRFISESAMVSFRYSIATFYFLSKRYSEAYDHIQLLHQISGRKEAHAYEESMARLMEWLCLYRTGSPDILDAALRNLRRYYAGRGLKDNFFDSMFAYLAAVLKQGGTQHKTLSPLRKKFLASEPEPQWLQLKGLVMEWSGDFTV